MEKLLLMAMLTSCGTLGINKKSDTIHVTQYGQLKQKYELYLEKGLDVTREIKFWHDGGCDSLLFTALTAPNKDIPVNIMDAFDGSQWHRRPDFMPECYPMFSKSSISKDMLIGVIWHAWHTKDIAILKQLKSYARSHANIMGRGVVSRTVLSAPMMTTIQMAIDRLEGKTMLRTLIPLELAKNDKGFEAHLAVLHALIRSDILGYAHDYYLDYFRYHARRQPKNALFLYAVALYTNGDMTAAVNVLLDESLFPNSGLSAASVRCEPWLWQRDFGNDWQPCDNRKGNLIYSGYDFLFMADLILYEIDR